VVDFSGQDFVERDLMLMKVATPGKSRSEIRELVEIFRAKIVDVSSENVMIEISGPESKINAFIDMMRPFGILEIVRTGRIALLRSEQSKQTLIRRQWKLFNNSTRTNSKNFHGCFVLSEQEVVS